MSAKPAAILMTNPVVRCLSSLRMAKLAYPACLLLLVRAWGELGIMRIMFAVAIFHAFMSLVTIGVKSSRDPRAALHNGLWLVKLVLLVGAMVGAFFINNTFFIGVYYSLVPLHIHSLMGQIVCLAFYSSYWSLDNE
jgi:hypothetical protein